ncbi:hypothetical protein SEVIR_3G408500v4 [Setaria viridis]|uniref:DUF4408 domain-containing protein n=2 Tax=Setaria TaxID=4554 RepID=K3Z882_SETIT|nr:uncharacterized protein LOC101772124 [Setaria italica]RCV19513.1 hypothetical protein SETIT_3G391400v2 [Setaria italica]
MLPLLNMEAPPPPPQSGKPPHQLMRTVSISVLVMSLPVLYVSFLHVPPAALFRDTTFWFLMSNSIIIVIAADSGMLFFGSSSSADDGGIPFAVVSSGEPSAGVKSGHASMGGVSVVSDEVVVQDQALVVTMEHGGDHLPVIAENDDLAYALVVREDQAERVVASTPASREIIISPSSAAAEVVATKNVDVGAVLPGTRPRSRLTASRSLAAREERPAATRRRHGHGHRPSHSHALVPVQDKSVVVSEEKRLRRAATDRRPSPEEENEKESEYSRLSDEELNRRVEEFITRFNREIRLQVEMEQAAAA